MISKYMSVCMTATVSMSLCTLLLVSSNTSTLNSIMSAERQRDKVINEVRMQLTTLQADTHSTAAKWREIQSNASKEATSDHVYTRTIVHESTWNTAVLILSAMGVYLCIRNIIRAWKAARAELAAKQSA